MNKEIFSFDLNSLDEDERRLLLSASLVFFMLSFSIAHLFTKAERIKKSTKFYLNKNLQTKLKKMKSKLSRMKTPLDQGGLQKKKDFTQTLLSMNLSMEECLAHLLK